MLNFKPTKQTVPFLCPDVPFLEDRLPEQNPQGERDKAGAPVAQSRNAAREHRPALEQADAAIVEAERALDDLVKGMGMSGVSKSQVSRVDLPLSF